VKKKKLQQQQQLQEDQRKRREEEEKRQKNQEEEKKKIEEEKKKRSAEGFDSKDGKEGSSPDDPVVKARTRIFAFQEIKKVADHFEGTHKDEALKLKMSLNRPIQQVASTKQAILKSASTIRPVLKAAKEKNNEEFCYVLHQLASLLVIQGEERISKHQASAFPFAEVAFFLCMVEPHFTPIFLATLHTSCIYTIPMYLDRQEFKSMKEYKMALGYKKDAESEEKDGLETEETYFERMVGYMSLYCAFMQVSYNSDRHPHGLEAGWTWIARICNRPPRTATASILLTFLEVAGYMMNKTYPHQFKKIIILIVKEVIPRIAAKTQPQEAAKHRLELWIKTHIRHGALVVNEPEGRNLPSIQQSSTDIDNT